jgi:ribose transport system substrate-binding protein
MLGWKSVIDKEKGIKVVSNQSAAWDPTKAHDIIANVLQKNPDLCAVWGQFDEMDQGSAQAIREAGKTGKVKLFTYGGSPVTCKLVASGDFTKAYSFQASQVGSITAALAFYLVQADKAPGSSRAGMYVPTYVIDKSNAKQPNVCYDGKGTGMPALEPIG